MQAEFGVACGGGNVDGVAEGELCGGGGIGGTCEDVWDEGGGVWVRVVNGGKWKKRRRSVMNISGLKIIEKLYDGIYICVSGKRSDVNRTSINKNQKNGY